MMKQTVTTIALLFLASSAFSQIALKDELQSLKSKKEIAYQQTDQAKLDQIASVNKKYLEVLKQLLLKATASGTKDTELIWGIKRELAIQGHFEPEDWCYGTWEIHSNNSDRLTNKFKIDFDGSVYKVDEKTGLLRESYGPSKLEILDDSKASFKRFKTTYEIQKISPGKLQFTTVNEQGRRSESIGTRE